MKYKTLQYRENLYANYWLTPVILSLFAIILSFVTLYLDQHFSWYWLQKEELIYAIGADGARTILSTIATAIITVTSVTFSITVLTLSQASMQLGPRLLPNFMRQGTTQLVLGVFIATFIYCLFIMRAISASSNTVSTPYFSVIIAIVLGIVCFFLLIYLIHYVCHVIQVDTVLNNLAKELFASILRQFPVKDTKKRVSKQLTNTDMNKERIPTPGNPKDIVADFSGYIQTIDYQNLIEIATDHDIVIKVFYRPGEFVFDSLPILSISNASKLTNKFAVALLNCFQVGIRRTSVQDVEFAFNQLVEVAIRALSPGMNDPNTAISCLNQMAHGLSILNKRSLVFQVWYDKQHKIRLLTKELSYKKILDACFNQIRQYAINNVEVNLRILEIIQDLLSTQPVDSFKKALLFHAKLVNQQCQDKANFLTDDAEVIAEKYQKLLAIANEKTE